MTRKAIDWGDIEHLQNKQGKSLYKDVTIIWSRPRVWKRGESAPTDLAEEQPGYLYCLVRNHHRSKTKDWLSYIGITNNLKARFHNHSKATALRDKPGDTALSIGTIDFHGYRTAKGSGKRKAIEELEHILICAIWPEFNDRKAYSLPGIGSQPARAWRIYNAGYRFSGTMPIEIVYPWMLIKPGRDRSAKPS